MLFIEFNTLVSKFTSMGGEKKNIYLVAKKGKRMI